MRDFQRDIYNLSVNTEWDGQETGDRINHRWSPAGSLLYAVSAITTIGKCILLPND